MEDQKNVPMYCLTNVRRTPVIAEIIELAAKHSGAIVEYRHKPEQYCEMSLEDENRAHNAGYDPDRLEETHGSIWAAVGRDLGTFWIQYTHFEGRIKKPLNEPILPDNYRVHQGYFYVVNGEVREFIDGINMTVGHWKGLFGDVPVEIRECDVTGRTARRPLVGTLRDELRVLGKPFAQKRRRSRTSNKIKKVKPCSTPK